MKRILLSMAAMVIMASSACAQRLSNIRLEASYITEKMALELGLTDLQRNSILQLNINYLDGISSYRDINADGWKYRNKEIKRILSKEQWKSYKKANYFYHPIGWKNSTYVHNIYKKYPKSRFSRNNSPEAIKMRKDMRRGLPKGAR